MMSIYSRGQFIYLFKNPKFGWRTSDDEGWRAESRGGAPEYRPESAQTPVNPVCFTPSPSPDGNLPRQRIVNAREARMRTYTMLEIDAEISLS